MIALYQQPLCMHKFKILCVSDIIISYILYGAGAVVWGQSPHYVTKSILVIYIRMVSGLIINYFWNCERCKNVLFLHAKISLYLFFFLFSGSLLASQGYWKLEALRLCKGKKQRHREISYSIAQFESDYQEWVSARFNLLWIVSWICPVHEHSFARHNPESILVWLACFLQENEQTQVCLVSMSYDIRGHLTCRQGPHLHMEVLKVVETQFPLSKIRLVLMKLAMAGHLVVSLFLSQGMSCFAEL